MIRAVEFYSGIGGLHLALQRSTIQAQVVRAYDWDPAASRVYEENFGPNIVRRIDIAQLTVEDIIPLDACLWLLSPACQPYTVLNASARGAADPRAKSFLHLIENILPTLARTNAQPRWILVENVAGFENSSTRQILLSSLKTLGYNTAEFLLTPLQFSIPNSRLRYYLLAKLMPLTFAGIDSANQRSPMRNIPDCGTDLIHQGRHLAGSAQEYQCNEISHFLDHPDKARDPDYWQAYAVPDKLLAKRGMLFDVVFPHSRRTCCFTRGYTHMVEGTSILQTNESLDTTTTFNNYTTAVSNPTSGTDNNFLGLLHALRLRYFTPDELLRLFYLSPTQHEPSSNKRDFRWPTGISLKTKYRLIGNSVNVKVVQELTTYLFKGDGF